MSVNNLKDPLPAPVAEAIKQDFTDPPANADSKALKTFNDDYLKSHAQDVSHLQRGYNARFHLDSKTKPQNEADLLKLLDLPTISKEEAAEGLKLLAAWKSDTKTVDAYRTAAAKKWPQATVFSK